MSLNFFFQWLYTLTWKFFHNTWANKSALTLLFFLFLFLWALSIGENVFVNFESASERYVAVRWFRVMNEIVCESKKKKEEVKLKWRINFHFISTFSWYKIHYALPFNPLVYSTHKFRFNFIDNHTFSPYSLEAYRFFTERFFFFFDFCTPFVCCCCSFYCTLFTNLLFTRH